MAFTLQVLCGDGAITVAGLDKKFDCSLNDGEGAESALIKAVKKHWELPVKPVFVAGCLNEIVVDPNGDYEPCGTCGRDHAYDGLDAEAIKKHEEAGHG